jgi:hypothetical protein
MVQFSFSGIEMSDWENEQLRESLAIVLERFSDGGNAKFVTQRVGAQLEQFETMLSVKTAVGSLTAYAVGTSPLSSSLKAIHKVSDLVTSLSVISTRGGDHGYFSQNRAV